MKRLLMMLAAFAAISTPALVAYGTTNAADVFSSCNGSASGTAVCQDVKDQSGNMNGEGGPNKNNPIINIIKAAINILSFIIGIAAIITLVVSGIRFMTSNGDSQAVASARTGLIYALVGIAVVVLAQALVAWVLDKVG